MVLVHAPGALHEWPVDLELRRVGVHVDFLVRVLAVVMRRHVSGDHDHRYRVERGVRYAGRGVGEAGPEVREHYRGLLFRPRIAVGHVGGDLLMANVDEFDPALLHLREHGDVGVAAQAEHVLDATGFQVLHQLTGYELFHALLLRSGTSRRAVIVSFKREPSPARRLRASGRRSLRAAPHLTAWLP